MTNYFTHDDWKPSEKTLNIIRQVAYTYRAYAINGRYEPYCLN